MWWHGGAGLTERSERGSLSAVATHDVFGVSSFSGEVCIGIDLAVVANKEQIVTRTTTSLAVTSLHAGTASWACWAWRVGNKSDHENKCDPDQCRESPYKIRDADGSTKNDSCDASKHHDTAAPKNTISKGCILRYDSLNFAVANVGLIRIGSNLHRLGFSHRTSKSTHLYQRGRTSITGFRFKLRKSM